MAENSPLKWLENWHRMRSVLNAPLCPSPPVDKAALKEQFEAFAKFGDKSADGKTIKLSQSDKWFKQAKVIQPKKVSTTDTGIAFRKISK